MLLGSGQDRTTSHGVGALEGSWPLSLEQAAQAGRQVHGTQDRWREATDPTLQKRV